VVAGLADAVQGGIAHDQVGVGHVDFGPQHPGPVFEFAGTHALEQVQVFLDAAVAPGAVFARFGEGAPVFPDFVGIEVVHVGLAGPDELDGKIEELFEIIRGIVQAVIPVNPIQRTSSMMASTYSTSSLVGLVSSKRRLQVPL
jgi:hypothetical protein